MSLQTQQIETVTSPPATDLKRCPRCERWLSRSDDFGICRARADGLNLYCRECVRQKIHIYRAGLREYLQKHPSKPAAQPKLFETASPHRISRALRKLSPVDRVLKV